MNTFLLPECIYAMWPHLGVAPLLQVIVAVCEALVETS